MHVEAPSVHIMKLSLEIDAESMTASTQKFRILRPVQFTNPCGRSISKHIAVIISWECEECFNDLMNYRLGKDLKIILISLMMKKTQIMLENTFSVQLALIVLKQLLLLVVL